MQQKEYKKAAPSSYSSYNQSAMGGENSPFSKKKKACPFTSAKVKKIDYKDLETLKQFVTERGKIVPRRITGVSCYHQKVLRKAIKQARFMALLPFVGEE